MPPLTISAPPGTDGAQLQRRVALLRKAFGLLRKPSSAQQQLLKALDYVHQRNVHTFGWQTAETMRAVAFADAMEDPLPVGDATDSDIDAFTISQRGGL